MSTALILSLVAVAISLGVVLIASRSSRPRITQIETRRDDDVDGEPGAR